MDPLHAASLPTRERGLKHAGDALRDRSPGVAPHAGAWIETGPRSLAGRSGWSLPTRERGLKRLGAGHRRLRRRSLPTRERGLKPQLGVQLPGRQESLPTREPGLNLSGAPYGPAPRRVAPHAGAWIETCR